MAKIHRQIAQELGVRDQQVEAAVTLLDGGATVPFIARYRKELTGALDDAQLRTLEERLTYLRELEERRTAVLNSIREQGKLDAALEAAILAADTKGRLEDIYAPFKPKRRTKAEIAREAGLEPLSEMLLTQPQKDPQAAAAAFVDAEKGVEDIAAALEGARAILTECFDEDADLKGALREEMWSQGRMASTVRERQEDGRGEVQGLFRLQRASAQIAVAPHPGDVPRREGGNSRSADTARSAAFGAWCSQLLRAENHEPLWHFPSGASRRQLAGGYRALGLAHQDSSTHQYRSAHAAMDGGRDGGRARVRLEPARSLARGTGRSACHHGA